MITVPPSSPRALICPCGCIGFSPCWTTYEPSGTLLEMLKGRVDAHCHGHCARCGQHVHAVIKDTRRGLHDPADL